MTSAKIYESYPIRLVLLTNLLMLTVYFAGAYILFQLHFITGILYLAYLILLEFKIYREGCINCCYYKKRCAFGKGIIAGIFFKRGDPKKFGQKKIKPKDFIPQLLVSLIPMFVGVALLISRGFDIFILIATIYPIFSWFVLNPIIYGKIACPHCKQGSICCPALKFFTKRK